MTANWPAQLTKLATVTTSSTVTAGKHNSYNATAGALVATLPPLTTGAVQTALAASQVVRVKVSKAKSDVSANAVTVTCAAGDTFEAGGTTVALTASGEKITLVAGTIPGASGPTWISEEHTVPRDVLDTRYPLLSGGSTISGPLFWRGANDTAIIVAKPTGDGRAGVFDLINNDTTGYIFHLVLGASADHSSTALIALGIDNDGIGILAPNKNKGRAIVGDQRATTVAGAYWLHATNRSTTAALMRLEQQTDAGSDLLQLLSFGTQTSGNLLYVGDPSGQAGTISAADGTIQWRRGITVQDLASGTGTSFVDVTSNNGVAAGSRQYTRHVKDGFEFYAPTGTAGSWWTYKIFAGGSFFRIQAGTASSAVGTLGTMSNIIAVRNNQLSFFSATPVAQPTGTPAAATDATTTQALVNSIRASLIALGLIA